MKFQLHETYVCFPKQKYIAVLRFFLLLDSAHAHWQISGCIRKHWCIPSSCGVFLSW